MILLLLLLPLLFLLVLVLILVPVLLLVPLPLLPQVAPLLVLLPRHLAHQRGVQGDRRQGAPGRGVPQGGRRLPQISGTGAARRVLPHLVIRLLGSG